ncbi:diguanylate cyclase [Glaciecola sp. MH2013]|uniref:GGDEF domain-containing protein n=1 Tax=Glaciecola sp. MH2013 TaxID=2785524 RepID=UPI00189E3617|nr:GGDEF domain-containing protein [Glaciecola sp. MH2013]MBF7072819.1 diguanylate cyclase [Glaciecola sp. MH2013]
MIELNNELDTFKSQVARRMMLGLLLLCTIGLPISLLRWFSIGFQTIFIVHIALSALTFLIYFRPNKTNYKLDYNYVCVFLTLLAASGVYSFGLQSGAIIFVVLASFLIATIYSIRNAIIYLGLFFTYMLTIGFCLSQGYLTSVVNASDYGRDMNAWAIIIFTCAITSALFLICASEYLKKLQNMLSEIKEQHARVEYLANHDHLTGLASPRLAQEQLELTLNLAKRHGFRAAILYIDVDDFKIINDALGHDAGDFALKQIAARLKEIIRDTDIACRQGGDEFLVILHYPVTIQDCELVCERLISAFDARIPYKEHELKISLSIGVSIYPDDGTNQDELRLQADKAMYHSKNRSKNSYKFATEESS